MKGKIIYLCILLASGTLLSQPLLRDRHAGFSIGFVSGLGTHIQRFGITLQGYYVYHFAQINAEVRAYDQFKNLGPPGEYPELAATMGLVLAYGKKHREYNRFLSPISNQTRYRNSVGYAYTFWFNKIGTTQQTGTIALQFRRVSVISENDIFARPTLDRFRTGAFLVQYQRGPWQYGLNCSMWTGQMGHVIRNDKNYPYGYVDTTGGRYTHYSHGLLSAQVKYAAGYGQYFQANAGIDAEQVRNAVQNRLIHDMVFIPRKWYTPTNSHIPMLDENGDQYLYKPGQTIRKPKPYVNLYTAPALFY